MYEERFMKEAISLSRKALEEAGTAPFGSVVVRGGEVVGRGVNRSMARCDPTSHSEVEAIRAACSHLQTLDLSDCDLYTSCEPCTMCVGTIMLSRVGRIYYASSLRQSGQALSGLPRAVPIDDLRTQSALPIEERKIPAEQKLDSEAVEVLTAWAAARTPG